MTTALETAPRELGLFGDQPEATLDEHIVEAWESLAAARPAACLACGGEMTPHHRPGSGELSGQCAHCGATLA